MAELALVLRIGNERRTFTLAPGGPPLIVGRSPDVAIPLKAPLLSRRHCELRLDERGLELVDLGSANGTFVNGRRIERIRVQPGDLVQVGEVDMRLEFAAPWEAGFAPASAGEPTSSKWAADGVPADELRCQKCGRRISMSTVRDGHSLEWGAEVVCPTCRDADRVDAGSHRQLATLLARDGYEVLAPISLRPSASPVLKARKAGSPEGSDLFAIKVLPLSAGLSKKKVDRFKAEARALAQIDHPNVVRVRDVQERAELLYLVLDYVDGSSLLQRVERGGRLPGREALAVGLAIARALEAAAKLGIVHRNVKPANILIAGDGTPRLVDFGLAKGVRTSQPGVTGVEEMLGTIRYMPPEQVRDARAADGRSDVYALAATLFHVFTGKLPYPYHSELDLLKSAITGTLPAFSPTPVDPLPPGVGPLLVRCLKHDPHDRPQPKEMADELERLSTLIAETTPQPPDRATDSQIFKAMTPVYGSSTRDFQRPQKPAPRPATGPTRAGTFARDELHALVQKIAAAGESGVLEVRSGGRDVGVLSIRDGKVVLAGTPGGGRGESAALEVLDVREGEYAFQPGLAGDVQVEHELALAPLVLESARRRHQARR